MGHKSKRFREIDGMVDLEKKYTIVEAIELLKKCPSVKFDQSVEISMKMGVDPRKSDQQVRSTVSLPNGTGKKTTVLVFAKGEKTQEALDAGADYAGDQEYIDKVKGGWVDIDVVIATPDMMREVGKLGKILGPRGLMPSPKGGTVTADVSQTVKEIKAGKVEFKLDRHGVINNLVGKLSFDISSIKENILALVNAIIRAKPAAAKGHYIKSVSLSSTMGPGLKIDMREISTS